MTLKRPSFILLIFIINANVFRNVLVLELLFSTAKAMLNIFAYLLSLICGFRIPDSGFWFSDFRVAPL